MANQFISSNVNGDFVEQSAGSFQGREKLNFMSPEKQYELLLQENLLLRSRVNFDTPKEVKAVVDPGVHCKKYLEHLNKSKIDQFFLDFEHYKRHDGIHSMVKLLSSDIVVSLQDEWREVNLLVKYKDDSVLRAKLKTLFPPISSFLVKQEFYKHSMDPVICKTYDESEFVQYRLRLGKMFAQNPEVKAAEEDLKIEATLEGVYPLSLRRALDSKKPKTYEALMDVMRELQADMRSAPLIMSLMTEETAQKANAHIVGAAMLSETVGTAAYGSGCMNCQGLGHEIRNCQVNCMKNKCVGKAVHLSKDCPVYLLRVAQRQAQQKKVVKKSAAAAAIVASTTTAVSPLPPPPPLISVELLTSLMESQRALTYCPNGRIHGK